MEPDSKTRIRWGFGTALAAILVVAVLALVPDPFFRYRVFATALDDVAGVGTGTPVFFRGAKVGEVRSVALDPATRTFAVRLNVLKAWRPSACSYISVASSNPFTAPRIDLVAVETQAALCRTALTAAGCEPLAAVPAQGVPLTGCRRSPDLIQTAAAAIGEAANVARTANQMAQRLQAMMQGTGGGGSAVDMATIARNATGTLAALNSLSVQLDRNLAPGKGDIALTLANVRKMSGRASTIDITALNGILRETRLMVAQNQASIQGLLSQGNAGAGEARAMLQAASASLVSTSTNLERVSDNLGALTERVAADPTFVIRGQRYADPPAPGTKP